MNPAIDTYLEPLEQALPGGYTGVCVTGSTAIGDWRPDRSDLDIRTLTNGPLSAESLDALAAAHHALVERRPHLDAIYVPVASVGRRLAGAGVPYVVDGVPASPISSDAACFALLGPGRPHHTIATGQILTKTAAADYTAERFPAYAELLGRAKAWRLGDDSVTFTAADGLAICALIDAVIADAD
jgi:hypothetical protein